MICAFSNVRKGQLSDGRKRGKVGVVAPWRRFHAFVNRRPRGEGEKASPLKGYSFFSVVAFSGGGAGVEILWASFHSANVITG